MSKAPYVRSPAALTGKLSSYASLRTGNGEFDVVSGSIDRTQSDGSARTSAGRFEATLNGTRSSDRAQLNFEFNGDIGSPTALSDGSLRSQLSVTVQNVLVAWRGDGTVVCAVRSGSVLRDVLPTSYVGGATYSANDNVEHVLQVEWDSETSGITAWCDGELAAVWTVPSSLAVSSDVEAGVRTDNSDVNLFLFV